MTYWKIYLSMASLMPYILSELVNDFKNTIPQISE